ncbi:MAG: CBS domain-containing protein [Hyphomicrobiales bacterium]|nr:CBS domain-containing protein [Hyphomicrobiales bacterium]MCP4998667.1 CBS domain-containing protein [Hyphomicrobiales bacterium]
MKVKDVMHSGVSWVEPDTKLKEIAQIMQNEDIGAVPVGENDRLIGMVTDRDITCRALSEAKKPETLTARDVMSPGITWCKDGEEIEDAIRIMEKKKIRRLPVINDEKRMVGMLSIGDIAGNLPQDLTGEVMRAVAEHHR